MLKSWNLHIRIDNKGRVRKRVKYRPQILRLLLFPLAVPHRTLDTT